MEAPEIQKFLHDLNNHLNSANLNASLLRRLHAEVLDEGTIERLEIALRDADRIAKEFRAKLQAELIANRIQP